MGVRLRGVDRSRKHESLLPRPIASSATLTCRSSTAQAGNKIEPWLPRDGSQLVLDERRALINPGSVGQPRDGDRRASGMLLDTEQMRATWHRVEYPVAQVQQLMEKAGLPKRLVARLSHGL